MLLQCWWDARGSDRSQEPEETDMETGYMMILNPRSRVSKWCVFTNYTSIHDET